MCRIRPRRSPNCKAASSPRRAPAVCGETNQQKVLFGNVASLQVSALATIVRNGFEESRLDCGEQLAEGDGLERATWTWP